MFEYTFNKPGIIFLELINPLLQNINLNPYTLEYNSDILKLIYTEELTTEQYNTLNAFITNYTPPLTNPVYNSSIKFQIVNSSHTNVDQWMLIGTCQYILTDLLVDYVNVTFIANINEGSYQVRVYNMTNNIVIGTSSVLNNTVREINTINIQDKPSQECIIELHVKLLDDSTCNIDSAQINLFI